LATVTFKNVNKAFTIDQPVITDFNLSVNNGELLVLVGPSGCGKTTILRMVAGLDEISSGEIVIGGDVVNNIPPKDRRVAMVFQNYALYPHMTVRNNLAFPLRMQKIPPEEIEKRIDHISRMLDLMNILDRKPKALSGGQRQRVAMGRAIIRDANVFLMDEPLSNLDASLRMQIRTEISRLQARLGITTIYVTHDQVEAMTLGHRVAVMHQGAIQQVASPYELYHNPVNIFVAGFIGSPGMNVFPGNLEKTDDGIKVLLGNTLLSVEMDPDRNPLVEKWIGKTVLVGIRPEFISTDKQGANTAAVNVVSSETLGHETIVYFDAGVNMAMGIQTDPINRPDIMAAILPGHRAYKAGTRLELDFNPKRFYLFSPEGKALSLK